ncbi:MAG: transcriptional regulator [Ruminococcus sp.]|nr:transcriptional regulator [Ruminococcus sp.]
MTREEFIKKTDEQLRLVRTEYALTQESMAGCLGLSKKTLVGIEKGRCSLGWTGAAALCSLFSQSTVLQNTFGGDMQDMLKALAFEKVTPKYPKTMGGRVWWQETQQGDGWHIQQNYISRHYRLLTDDDRHVFSSFELDKVKAAAEEFERERGK